VTITQNEPKFANDHRQLAVVTLLDSILTADMLRFNFRLDYFADIVLVQFSSLFSRIKCRIAFSRA